MTEENQSWQQALAQRAGNAVIAACSVGGGGLFEQQYFHA